MTAIFDNVAFESEINGCKVKIKEHTVDEAQVFHVLFEDGRKPLIVSKVSTATGKMWMSIPQGRQKEALLIGEKIKEYFKKK